MSVETFDINNIRPDVRVTAAAASHLLRHLAPKGLHSVRIYLKKSGCTGYMYEIDEVEGPAEGDLSVEIDDRLTVFVPAGDLPMLNGMELDYVQEGVNRRLVFNNPNARDECGCGESVSFEE